MEDPERIKDRAGYWVMDDEEAIRETMGDMLSTMGYDTEYALNGQDAIAMIEKANGLHA